jgi:hypothetical protein
LKTRGFLLAFFTYKFSYKFFYKFFYKGSHTLRRGEFPMNAITREFTL